MGISLEQAHKLERSCISKIVETYRAAAQFYWSASFLNEQLQKLYSGETYTKLPKHMQSYVRGYQHAKQEAHETSHIEWRMFVDGKLLNRAEVMALSRAEVADKDPEFRTVWRRIENDKSAHTYVGRADKLF